MGEEQQWGTMNMQQQARRSDKWRGTTSMQQQWMRNNKQETTMGKEQQVKKP